MLSFRPRPVFNQHPHTKPTTRKRKKKRRERENENASDGVCTACATRVDACCATPRVKGHTCLDAGRECARTCASRRADCTGGECALHVHRVGASCACICRGLCRTRRQPGAPRSSSSHERGRHATYADFVLFSPPVRACSARVVCLFSHVFASTLIVQVVLTFANHITGAGAGRACRILLFQRQRAADADGGIGARRRLCGAQCGFAFCLWSHFGFCSFALHVAHVCLLLLFVALVAFCLSRVAGHTVRCADDSVSACVMCNLRFVPFFRMDRRWATTTWRTTPRRCARLCAIASCERCWCRVRRATQCGKW